jgi:uncharacterized protein YcbK (DUF882 family)
VLPLSLGPILGLVLTLSATGPVRPAVKAKGKTRAPAKPRVVELYQVNTREVLSLRYADERGRPVKGLQKKADQFFRCHHTNTRGRMNPRLVRLVFEAGRHWPGRKVEVVSGYRHPTVAKNPHSPHMLGLACDFRVTGVTNVELRDYLRKAFPHVGVGYYPNSSFVHLDVRKSGSAFWIDYSGPGKNALYSDNPGEDLKSGRADAFRPAQIDPSWAETDDDAPGAEGQPAPPAPSPAPEDAVEPAPAGATTTASAAFPSVQ